MRVVVGRDAHRSDIQVPEHFSGVSRAHLRISDDDQGGYLIEDLDSTHGTYVEDAGAWRRVRHANVGARTNIRLAEFQTTVGELLGSRPTGTSPAVAPLMPMAARMAAVPLGAGANVAAAMPGPGAAAAGAPQSEEMPLEILLKLVGVGDLLRILTTLHNPFRGIRRLISEEQRPLYQALIAYVCFVGLAPLLHKEVTLRLGELTHYPVVMKGQALENALTANIIAVISGLVGFAVMYSLPRALYKPNTPTTVVAANIYSTMYVAFYTFMTDFVKGALFLATGAMTLSIYTGYGFMALMIAFQIYIWRALLRLRWWPIVLFVILGFVLSFAQGFILGWLGLITFS